jgi:hypothetical protein
MHFTAFYSDWTRAPFQRVYGFNGLLSSLYTEGAPMFDKTATLRAADGNGGLIMGTRSISLLHGGAREGLYNFRVAHLGLLSLGVGKTCCRQRGSFGGWRWEM